MRVFLELNTIIQLHNLIIFKDENKFSKNIKISILEPNFLFSSWKEKVTIRAELKILQLELWPSLVLSYHSCRGIHWKSARNTNISMKWIFLRQSKEKSPVSDWFSSMTSGLDDVDEFEFDEVLRKSDLDFLEFFGGLIWSFFRFLLHFGDLSGSSIVKGISSSLSSPPSIWAKLKFGISRPVSCDSWGWSAFSSSLPGKPVEKKETHLK